MAKKKRLPAKARRVLATHEAGHTVFCWFSPDLPKPDLVTLVEDDDALAHTRPGQSDMPFDDERTLLADIASDLAGRVAEMIVFGVATTLADEDLKNASKKARDMVIAHGIREKTGLVTYVGINLPPAVADMVEAEVHAIIVQATAAARILLDERRKELGVVTEALLKEGTLSEWRLKKLLEPRKKTNARRK